MDNLGIHGKMEMSIQTNIKISRWRSQETKCLIETGI
jgi:hypothetical protein